MIITPVGKDDAVSAKAEEVYAALRALGVDVLLDDRSERPGVKFKDADLIGIPIRITIGKRGLEKGEAEVKERNRAEADSLPFDGLAEAIAAKVRTGGGRLLEATKG